jgi:iron complex outermembrane recepter protein
MKNLARAPVVLVLVCSGVGTVGMAQESAPSGLDAATTRSTFDAADLHLLQISDTLDLSRAVPNLTSFRSAGTGNSDAYFLRGLGNAETVSTIDPVVGTYIDGLFISRQSSNNYALFDIDRVEVLRGPQGTQSGRNSAGGAILVETTKPAPEAGSIVDVAVGSFGRSEVRGTIDHPIDERWLTRFSAFYEQADGFVRSTVTGEEINDRKRYGVRAAMRFLASPAATWDLWVENFYRDEINPVRDGADADASPTAFSSRSGPGSELEQALRGEGLHSYTHSVRVLSTLNWRIGEVDVAFITGRVDESWDYTLDFDPTGTAGGQSDFAVTQLQDTYQWSQEIRARGAVLAGRLRYVGGIFWLDEKNQTIFQDISVNQLSANGPVGATWLQIDRTMVNRTRSLAAYGQLDFAATEALLFTAGLRYTDEDKSIRYSSRSDRRPNTVLIYDISTDELVTGGVPVELHAGRFTPRVAASYELNADWSLQASATRGFRSGGWNGRGSASAPCFHTPTCYQAFDPETLWTYEAGVTAALPAHHLNLRATLFQTDVNDLQLVTGVRGAGGISFLTRNAADARFRGVEVELGWQPLDGLDLHANLGLLDGAYSAIVTPSLLTTDTRPVHAPQANGSIGALYHLRLGDLPGRFSAGGNLTFTGSQWSSTLNAPDSSHVPSHWQYQAQAGYEAEGGHWNANLSCTNCGNAQFVTTWFLGPYVNEPRRLELRAAYRF